MDDFLKSLVGKQVADIIRAPIETGDSAIAPFIITVAFGDGSRLHITGLDISVHLPDGRSAVFPG